MSELEVKERLAHSIFLEMMNEAGYDVKKLDYEEALQEILKVKNVDYKEYISDIRDHNRDFLMFGKTPLMMQVIFSESEIRPSAFDFPESLGGALLVIITPFSPFFHIGIVRDFCNGKPLYSMSDNPFLNVPENLVAKYGKLVSNRLK